MLNLVPVQDNNVNILVIGAGVSGLTTAICLREAGFNVIIIADRFTPDLTSVVAGALWEWPPAVCGRHGTPRSLERSKEWCMDVHKKLWSWYEKCSAKRPIQLPF